MSSSGESANARKEVRRTAHGVKVIMWTFLWAVSAMPYIGWTQETPGVIPIQIWTTADTPLERAIVPVPLSFLAGEVQALDPLNIVDGAYRAQEASFQVRRLYPDGSLHEVEAVVSVHIAPYATVLFLCTFDEPPVSRSKRHPASSHSLSQELPLIVQIGNIGALMDLERWAPTAFMAWEEMLEPPWWATVRTSMRLLPLAEEALSEQMDYIDRSYAEHGMAREAIKLYNEVYAAAQGEDPNVTLRAAYEIARLYEVYLGDPVRSFKWYKRCNAFHIADPEAANQNVIASSFGMLRCYEALRYEDKALALYGALWRQLRVHPSMFGRLILPQIHLRIGNLHKKKGHLENAVAQYRSCIEAVQALPEDVPFIYRTPAAAAGVYLRQIQLGQIRLTEIKDGTYEGTGSGYNSFIRVRVEIKAGRIVHLYVLEFNDKKPRDAYVLIQQRILSEQRVEVDAVTGATVSSDGIKYAVEDALYRGRWGSTTVQ